MAEEKKAKIDLKTRLKKMGAGGQLEAPGSSPNAIPVPGRSAPGITPPPSPAIPIPPGVPSPFGSRPPPMDPNNPLAAVAVPFRTNAPPPPPSAPIQPQRIEVDEAAVHQARASTRNFMLVVTFIAAGGLGAAGYFAGKASGETGGVEAARTLAASNTRDMVGKLKKLRGELENLVQLVKDGRSAIFDPTPDGKHTFPADLAQKMGNVKFSVDTSDIADKRFVGKAETVRELYDFVASLQTVSERQKTIQGYLNALKTAFEEEFKGTDSYKVAIVFEPTAKGEAKDYNLLPLKTPFPFPVTKEKPFPEKFGLPGADVSRYTGGDVKERFALPINPKSMDQLCVPKDQGKKERLQSEMGKLIQDISKEIDPNDPNDKEGILKREQTLENELSKSAG